VETWYGPTIVAAKLGGAPSKPLRVRLAGEIGVLRGGKWLGLPASKKTRALLGYLIATGTAHSRQGLCDLFWEGPDDPRAALRWSLTKLRPLIDDRDAIRLVADREHVSFAALGATVDVFEAAAHVGPRVEGASTDALRRATAAVAGDFFEGLDLPDCYRFHEWCIAERERVRGLRLSWLDALVDRLVDEAPEEALLCARQRLAIDPLSDVAHATAVKLLARLGRTAEAHAQVETCRRILDRELGGRRSPALEMARMEIGKGSPPEQAPVAPPAAPEVADPPPSGSVRAMGRAVPGLALVGRADERAALEAFVVRAARGRASQVILLSGEPGVGKSRLLAEVGDLVRARGGKFLLARAFEAESVRPFGIWTDVLREPALAVLGRQARRELAPLFPELGVASGDAQSRALLFDGVAKLLRELAASEPVILAVDDLHWLDEASAGLLHYVARVSDGTQIGVVCATRNGDLEDNPAALRFVRTLRRDGRLVNLLINPFGEVDTRALVEATGASEVDAARVFRESGGNALLAIMMARALSGRGHDAPQALDGLLEDRLSRVDSRARDLVVWAAALDREFDPELLAAVTGESLAHTVAAIGDLERDGLVTSLGARYAFTHDLVRGAAYRRLSGPRRRLVHLTIARTLAAASDPGATWGDVVHHASLADDAGLVARACVAAGERALRMLARRSARDFAARGLPYAARLGLDGLALRVELLTIAAVSSAMDPEKQVAFEEEAQDAVRVARANDRPEVAARALFALSFFRSTRGDFEGTHEVILGQAEAARSTSPAERIPAIANTAFCLALIERELPKARALLDEAAESARLHHLSIIDVELGEGYLAHMSGDLAHARGALGRALALARGRGDTWRESMALIRLAMVALESGALEAARVRAAELRAVSIKLGEGSEGAIADGLDALAIDGAGGAEGPAKLAAALDGLLRADAKAMLAYVLATAAEMAIARGSLAAASSLGTRALEAATPLGKPSAIALAHALLGRAALEGGDSDQARAHLAKARVWVAHPFGASKRSREAVDQLAVRSNGGPNASPHGSGA
jgi:DNA-binding SARP family transcriptional activator